MVKKLLLLFIVFLFYGTAWCQQDFYLKKIDSLKRANTKTTVDTTRINNFNSISFCYGKLGDAKNGNEHARKAIALANKIHWPKGVIKAYSSLANQPGADVEGLLNEALKLSLTSKDNMLTASTYNNLAKVTPDFNKKTAYYKKGLVYYKLAGNKKFYVATLGDLAAVYSAKGMYFEAIDYKKQRLRFAEKNYPDDIIDANRNLAITYRELGNTKKALQYYLATIRLQEKETVRKIHLPFISEMYTETGNVYLDLKDTQNALKHFNKALSYTKGEELVVAKINVLNHISKTYARLKEKQKALQYLNEAKTITDKLPLSVNKLMACNIVAAALYEADDYKGALKYYLELFDIVKQNEEGDNMLQVRQAALSGLGASYLGLARQDGNNKSLLLKSISCLEAVLPTYRQTNKLNELKTGLQQLADAYELTGQYPKSLAAYKDYLTYKDSLVSIERENAFVKKEAEFEYSQKENALKASQKIALEHEQTNRNYAYAGVGVLVLISLGAGVAYSRKRKDNRIIATEKKRSDDLLLNILPAEVAEELKTKGEAGAKHYDHVSILFTDFVGFTRLSEKFSPEELLGELNYCFKAFDEIITRHNIEKIKTIGDSYMAVSGLPAGNEDHALNAVNAAIEMRNFIENYKAERSAQGRVYFEMRTGINSGEIVAGIVGIKKFAYDVWGDAVNIASRMESNGVGGKINISQSTFDLVKDDFNTEYRGEIDAKGKGYIKMYFVEPKTN
jgi:adenylate cyclase